ncbi:hypothetical protein CDAR_396111 [Caerostris darwini]|uniref:Serine-threonine/tyrosine-protein kinase catalytic domain-containing protein n=1 Tax=Caerostris darwini TaxID=1538125 RepID=A0AAV4WMF3_9ARAC|nr:hypothetical protein CDAR_396111 [Caerostris darwini]
MVTYSITGQAACEVDGARGHLQPRVQREERRVGVRRAAVRDLHPGGHPLPVHPHDRLYEQLVLGHRMTKPSECPIEVYMLMRRCWSQLPCDRPTFEEIVKCVDGIMLGALETAYLELNLPVLSTPENSSSSEESCQFS